MQGNESHAAAALSGQWGSLLGGQVRVGIMVNLIARAAVGDARNEKDHVPDFATTRKERGVREVSFLTPQVLRCSCSVGLGGRKKMDEGAQGELCSAAVNSRPVRPATWV